MVSSDADSAAASFRTNLQLANEVDSRNDNSSVSGIKPVWAVEKWAASSSPQRISTVRRSISCWTKVARATVRAVRADCQG